MMPGFKDFKSVLKEKGLGGGFLDLVDGENRIRIVSNFVDYVDEFTDTKTGTVKKQNKFICWAIDRKDGAVKPFSFGPMIFEAIGNLATTSETAFDDLPPYDMIVKKSGSGIDTEYAVVGVRTNTSLTEIENAAIAQAGDLNRVVERVLAKKGIVPPAAQDVSYDDIPVIDPQDVPF